MKLSNITANINYKYMLQTSYTFNLKKRHRFEGVLIYITFPAAYLVISSCNFIGSEG